METAAIGHRVVDFLKKYAPFQAIAERDLLQLAQLGKVRFFESDEYIVWQGSSRFEILVIQQGTASLWDESTATPVLSDVRGAGDMLGIDQFDQTRTHAYSVKSTSDTLVYSFPAEDLLDVLLNNPYAARFLEAYSSSASEYRAIDEGLSPHASFVHDLVAGKEPMRCNALTTIRDATRTMLASGADALAITDAGNRVQGVLTTRTILEWVERGGTDGNLPVHSLLQSQPVAVSANTLVIDAVLAMSAADESAVTITSTGKLDGQLVSVVTSRDLGRVFGDQPGTILNDIRRAPTTHTLKELNSRTRTFALSYLNGAASVDWIAQFLTMADDEIIRRAITLAIPKGLPACWCVCDASGRAESLAPVQPRIALLVPDDADNSLAQDAYRSVVESLEQCGYLSPEDSPFDSTFYVASISNWRTRFQEWIQDPVFTAMYTARFLFDLRPVHGDASLWSEIKQLVTSAVDRRFLHILANDCLCSLPPLTFFEDVVVDESGGHAAIFRLEESALRPLVDVGRVFGMASESFLGASTLERLELARRLLPEQAAIFNDAIETFRGLLLQQGRIGISQKTNGAELPPAMLSRFDRQVLRNGFRSIHRLLEFTADLKWIENL